MLTENGVFIWPSQTAWLRPYAVAGSVPSPSPALTVTLTGAVAAFAVLLTPAVPPRVSAAPVSVATAAGHHGRARRAEKNGRCMTSSQAEQTTCEDVRSGVIVWTGMRKRQPIGTAHPG